MTVARATLLGAAGRDAGGGGTGETILTAIPDIVDLTEPNTPSQYGWEFQTTEAFTVYGMRCFVGESTSITVRLWRVSDETLLGSVTVSAVDQTWTSGTLGSPVALSSGANYVVSVRSSGGTARDLYYGNETDFTLNSKATYVQRRIGNSDAFPTTTSSTLILGIADCVL